jgi:hypothetical protein
MPPRAALRGLLLWGHVTPILSLRARLGDFSRLLGGFKLGYALGERVGYAACLCVGVSFGLELLFERGYALASVPWTLDGRGSKGWTLNPLSRGGPSLRGAVRLTPPAPRLSGANGQPGERSTGGLLYYSTRPEDVIPG